ncbi:HET-domain-containing protein [Lophium mytilinum]|uniref:HET-domain-containing protein n=1 Tax=Lophium mytilinum TaxID=390894 RepID=A0A6A6QAY5_9PEZI|nr:HET-domain-containing protein [Lophium mytilinum]
MPKRILQIESSDIPQAPFRIRLLNTNDKFQRYVALSHCWGLEQPLTTEEATVDAWMMDIPWVQLPKTFQHAIEITASLGCSHLWIDSLCIIQDSRTDWEEQSAQMAAIYQHAVVTVVAASAASDTEGFLGPRPKRLNGTVLFHPEGPNMSPRPVAFRESLSHYDDDVASIDPLEKRAWAFQERLLSARVLVFSLHELRWECNIMGCCECHGYDEHSVTWHVDTPHPYSRAMFSRKNRRDLYLFWYNEIIPRFTRASLTKGNDKLPALSGVVQVLSNILEDQYVAGVWYDGSIEGLLWMGRNRGKHHISGTYRAPSFSWASLDCEVIYDTYGAFAKELLFTEVVELRCTPAGLDPFGEVLDGYVILNGPLVSAWLHFSPETELVPKLTFQPAETTACDEYVNFQPDVMLAVSPLPHSFPWPITAHPTLAVSPLHPSFPWPVTVHRAEIDPGRIEGSYRCLLMRLRTVDIGDYYLVLGASLRKPGAFERLGMVVLSADRLKAVIWQGFKDATKAQLTIV